MDATQPSYTPSFVPTTPFAQMTAERRDTLSQIADIAQKAANIATIIKSPSGTVTTFAPPPSAQTPFASLTHLSLPNLIRNPVVIAGAAIALVLFLKK